MRQNPAARQSRTKVLDFPFGRCESSVRPQFLNQNEMRKKDLVIRLAVRALAAILAIVVLVTAFAVPDESLTGAAFWTALLATKAIMLVSGFALHKLINLN